MVGKIARRSGLVAFVVIALAACPLPFEFVPTGTIGGGIPSNDPANPQVTAAPALVITEITSGSAVTAVGSPFTVVRNVRILLESDTPGATILYATDGSDPVPGSSATKVFNQNSPIIIDAHGESAPVKAIAIGPNMYPSLMTDQTISLSYQQVAAPTFSPGEGNFSSDQSVTIATSTPGATIYYTIVNGTGPAPTPQPGQPGTLTYTGSIAVSGAGTAKSINAIAVKSEMINSSVSSGTFTIGDNVLYLDGAGDYINVPVVTYDFSGGFTVELGLNVTTHSANVHYVSLGDPGIPFLVLGNYGGAGDVSTWAEGLDPIDAGDPGSGGVLIDAGMLANTWYHLAFTFDGSNQIIYVDGNLVATVPTTGTLFQVVTDYVLTIGARNSGDSQYVSGMLDEVRVWSDARTQSEIQASMNGILSGGEAGLVGYWNFNDGSATDITGNGADGSLVGDAYIAVDAPLP